MSLHTQIEATKSVSTQTVSTTLEHDSFGSVALHDFANDRLENALVRFVVNSVSQREVDRVVFAGPNTNISKLTSSRKVLAIFVEGNRHDAICRVKCFFDTISVMYINVDVENARLEAKKFQNTEHDVWRMVSNTRKVECFLCAPLI